MFVLIRWVDADVLRLYENVCVFSGLENCLCTSQDFNLAAEC